MMVITSKELPIFQQSFISIRVPGNASKFRVNTVIRFEKTCSMKMGLILCMQLHQNTYSLKVL